MSALPVTTPTARRVCTECHDVELEPDASGDLCPGCSLELEQYRESMRALAQVLEQDRRDECRCYVCSSWTGPAPLGGKRAHCRAVGEMREARA